MTETFRQFVHRKLLSQEALPWTPPKSTGSPVSTPGLQAADVWFERQDQARISAKIAKETADAAFTVRCAPIKAKAARARNAASHAEKRNNDADVRGVAVRPRTDCSAMTDEQKEVHHREVGRLKKQRQRAMEELQSAETFGIF